jgi:hypothetical protein
VGHKRRFAADRKSAVCERLRVSKSFFALAMIASILDCTGIPGRPITHWKIAVTRCHIARLKRPWLKRSPEHFGTSGGQNIDSE